VLFSPRQALCASKQALVALLRLFPLERHNMTPALLTCGLGQSSWRNPHPKVLLTCLYAVCLLSRLKGVIAYLRESAAREAKLQLLAPRRCRCVHRLSRKLLFASLLLLVLVRLPLWLASSAKQLTHTKVFLLLPCQS
jgi:hypothetical protein